jgi:Putative zinc-finger
MERAPLRPVPKRPAAPVDPQLAIAAVESALPRLDERTARALALVALSGRNRAEAAARLGVGSEELAADLATGRKALRRSVAPLAGSGWCERAERLISDRLDGALDETGAARLDAHLRNCERCVEHERRLVQATDALLTTVAEPSGAPSVPAAPAELRALGPARTRAGTAQIAVLPFGEPVAPGKLEPRQESRAETAWRVAFALSLLVAVAVIALLVIAVLSQL